MNYFPIILVGILAVIDWIAADRKIKILEYIAKPATMLAILLWIGGSVGFGGSMLWFTVGVIFCLAGDVFLMLPWDLFIFGLLAFLLGQISYVIGFSTSAPYLNLWGLFLIIMLGLYMGWLFPILTRSLIEQGRTKLKIPVLIYSIVISAMVYSALMTWSRPGWTAVAALAGSIGALAFFTSDSILAWDRFVMPLSHSRLKTMIFYHIGVVGIILGALLHAG